MAAGFDVVRDREDRYLFPHEDDADRPVPRVNNAHDAALKHSGVDHFVLYDCRHTWATRAVEAGVDLVTLAAMMGHSRIQMVLRYAHPSQEHQFKAMDLIEQYVMAQRAALITLNSSEPVRTGAESGAGQILDGILDRKKR